MNDLKVHVERAVRPVRARLGRKMRMRRELLAHLTAIYDEERAALGDDQLALARAVRRFGDPADLARELQATVPRVERWLHTPLAVPRRLEWLNVVEAGRGVVGLLTDPGRLSAKRVVAASARYALLLFTAGLTAGVLAAPFALATGAAANRLGRGLGVLCVLTGYMFVAVPLGVGVIRAAAGGLRPGAVARSVGFAAGLLVAGAATLGVLRELHPTDPLWRYLVAPADHLFASTSLLAGWVVYGLLAARFAQLVGRWRRRRAALELAG